MLLPIEIFTDLAKKHGVTLLGSLEKDSVPGLRVLGAGEAVPADGWLYAAAPPPAFINEAMELTNAVSAWLLRQQLALEAGAGPQELIDLSEGVLGEPVLVADPSMKRLAATRGVATEDTFFNEVSKIGYPTPETYEQMGRAQYYDHRFYTGDMIRLQTQGAPPLDVALRALRSDGRLMATALMLFQQKPWSEGQVRLFSLLTEALAACLEKSRPQSNMRSRQYEFLLRDLLDGKQLTEDEMQARLSYTDYPRQDACHTVVFSAGDGAVSRLSYVCRLLEGVFRYSRPIIYEGLVLTTLPTREGKKSESLDELERFCAEADAFCGVSARMERLSTLRQGYEQARDTLMLGRRLSREGSWFSLSGGTARPRVFYHETFAPYRAILAYGEKQDISSLCCQGLAALRERDEKNGTDNMRVLYQYLICHMNYTETAKRLFMHRNSVIYRIERICEILRVDGVSRQTEVELLFSYMALDMM